MKKVLVIGASGRVGSRLVEYSLEENFLVTALIRKNSDFNLSHPNLKIVIGDVLDENSIRENLEGSEIIFSCLSGKKTKPDYSVLTIAIQNILKSISNQRLIIVAGAGILEDEEFGLRRNRPNYPEIFKLVSAENWTIYNLLKNTNINWTMICAPEMPNASRTKLYRLEKDFLPKNGSRISVEDVADAMLKIMEIENTFQTRIGISY